MLFPLTTSQTDFTKTHKLLYGFPKSGKSTLASHMHDASGRIPLFVATEEGHGTLNVSRAKLSGWEGFLKFLAYVEANKQRLVNEHSTFVVDLMSDLDSWCSTAVATKKNIEYIGDLEQGKGWKLLKDELHKGLTHLMQLLPVTFICHATEKRMTYNGEQIITTAPSLSKAAFEFINGKVDAIMMIVPASQKKLHPEVTCQNSLAWIAGCRQKSMQRSFAYDPANPKATWLEMCRVYAEGQLADQAANAAINNPVPTPATPAAT